MAVRVALNDVPPEDGGKYAILKSTDELNAGDRRAVRGAVSVKIETEGEGENAKVRRVLPGDYDDQMQNALLARIVTDWNLDLPVPKGDVSVFDRMDIDMLDRLYEAVTEHVAFLNKGVPDPTKRDSDPTTASAS
jgi:hypothetical protein